MPERQSPAPRRALCAHCGRPASTCVCRLLPALPLENAVELLVLQHPDETRQAKGTATLLRLGLAHCEIRIGERFEPPALSPGRQDCLLYPADADGGASAAPMIRPGAGPGALRLIVLDATWRKSRRLLIENAWLQALPRLALEAAAPSGYAALRKARRDGQLATLEAALLALEQLEAPTGDRYGPLWQAFERFVSESAARRTPLK